METRATKDNIDKYVKVLKSLHTTLQNTSRVSMLEFSVKNKVTKNLSTVLQSGGVISLKKRGRFPEWEWNTIPPNRDMAIRVLQELSKFNPERLSTKEETTVKEVKKRGGKRIGAGRKTKEVENRCLESYTVFLFFGLIKIKVKLNYK